MESKKILKDKNGGNINYQAFKDLYIKFIFHCYYCGFNLIIEDLTEHFETHVKESEQREPE